MKECITHHKACDCKEEATRKLILDLMEVEAYADPERRLIELRAEAMRLGYVQGRSDRPAAKGVAK